MPPGSDLLHVRGTGSAGDPVDVRLRSHTGPGGYAASDLLDDVASTVPAGSEVEPPFVVEIGGREWTARNVSWDEPTGPVVEVHLAVAVDDPTGDPDGRSSARLLLATGRVEGSGLDADYDVLQSVLETMVVGGDA
ncbi:MAG TPA: hypothetical protein VFI44_00105 [Ornithinibacter sp.]|nr:hypothetical protein [Ornithinibacter sp.]